MRHSLITGCLCFAGTPFAQFVHNQLPIGSSFPVAGENATYDYVVVGAGTAGLTLATRLAQDGRYSVAVLEAGGFYELDNGNRSSIPGYDFYSSGRALEGTNPLIDWMYLTTPQAGGDDQRIHYPRGKCLGGSSARNYMVYQRPSKGAMKLWADTVGDQSWEWENVLPYYERSSNFTPPDVNTLNARGLNATPQYDASVFSNGPLQVSFPNYASSFSTWLQVGWKEAGDPVRSEGMQSGELLGHAYLPQSLEPEKQERSSSQTSYLDLALKTTQLYVYTHALAKRILFDSNHTATGVSVETDGQPYTISAAKEVILSAGAFGSPQLLMVSGIGPREILHRYDIPVIREAPGVGQNMEDNPFFAITIAVDLETGSIYQNSLAAVSEAINEYNEQRTGYLTSSGADVISFQRLVDRPELNISSEAKQGLAWMPDDWPDTMFWSLPVWVGPGYGSVAPDTRNYAGIVGSLTAPLSRGTVTINSSDTADLPIINPNWMTSTTDQEMAVAAMWRIREVLNTTVLRSISVGSEAYPGANVTSYADLLSVIRQQTFTFSHASATCKMGMHNDSMAVVDSKARVIGVNNLRVVDISAFPFLPPGQPQATVYMLGEKIADEILHDVKGASKVNKHGGQQ